MLRKFLPAVLIAITIGLPAAAVLTTPAVAQSQKAEQIRVRGSIISFTGTMLKVKTREGKTVDVTLAEGCMVSGVARAAVTDIKPGDLVGIASLPKADLGDGALEAFIFPPALKGTGEGSYGWDLKPNSSMTNATVADAVKDVDGSDRHRLVPRQRKEDRHCRWHAGRDVRAGYQGRSDSRRDRVHPGREGRERSNRDASSCRRHARRCPADVSRDAAGRDQALPRGRPSAPAGGNHSRTLKPRTAKSALTCGTSYV